MSYLGFAVPESLVDWQVFGARVHFGDNVIEATLRDRIAVLVNRAPFDQFLLSRAEESGARVIWQEVTSVKVRDDGVTVLTRQSEFSAQYIIVCGGANCRLTRLVRKPDTRDEKGFCLVAEIPVRVPDPFHDLEGLIDIYFGVAQLGYGWVFHHGDHYSVGVGGLCSEFPKPRAAFDRFVQERGLGSPLPRPIGHLIPCGGIRRALHSDRILLAGDAAGFVDPFYGEGIAYAVKSGQLAAEALATAMAGHATEAALGSYERACETAFARNLKYSLFLTRMMHRWPSLFLGVLSTRPEVLRRYLLVPATKSSYAQFLRWLVPRAPLYWLCSRLGL